MHDSSSEFERADAMRGQIVTFSASAHIRSRKSKILPWLRWDDRVNRGAMLIVRTASLEIVGHSRWRRRRRCYVFPGEAGVMRSNRGWLTGVPIEMRDWLIITVADGMQFAVSPEEDLDSAWQALMVAGVRPG